MNTASLMAWLADRRRWRRWLVDALIVLAIVVGVGLWQTRGLPSGPAPALRGVDPQGRPLSLAGQLAGNRPVLVVFWATWCGVCKAELGTLAALAGDQPVIAVAMRSGDGASVAAFLRERGVTLPVLLDEDGSLAGSWRVQGVPAHFIVDAHGQIRFRTVGYTPGWALRLRLWWASLG